MAITSAICSSFKQELLEGKHDFQTSGSGGHTFKIALFTSSASLGAATTDYSTSNEITNTSGSAYSAGGKALTNTGVGLTSTTAFTDFSDISWTSASFTANGALIYNTTTDGGSGTTDAVCVIAFGSDKTATNGTFEIQFPQFSFAIFVTPCNYATCRIFLSMLSNVFSYCFWFLLNIYSFTRPLLTISSSLKSIVSKHFIDLIISIN